MQAALILILSSFLCQSPATYVLHTEEEVWDMATTDLTQNKHKDILILSCDTKSHPLNKRLYVFLADEQGGYPKKASSLLNLEAETGVLFLAECDGEAPKELITADAGGARVYTWKDNAFTECAQPRFNSLLPSGSKEPVFMAKAAKDLNEDGIDEWLIPNATGVDLRSMEGLISSVRCDVVSEIRRGDSTYISHRLPALHFFEQETSEQLGIAFLSDEVADFSYGEGWKESQTFRIPMNLAEKWEASSKMADINQDGFPDLMVTQTKGTINLEVLSQIYIATTPFHYEEKPTATFSNKGSIASPSLVDIDGDKDLDLLNINIPFGVKNFVNFFVRGKLSVNADVYLFDGESYPEKPSFKTSLTMDAPEGREQVAYAMGDFDGDKRLDVCFGKEADALVIRLGEADRFVSNKDWVSINVPSFGIAKPVKLNDNEQDDILLYHPGGENAKRIEVILF